MNFIKKSKKEISILIIKSFLLLLLFNIILCLNLKSVAPIAVSCATTLFCFELSDNGSYRI